MKILWHTKLYNSPMSAWNLVHMRDNLVNRGIEIVFFNILKYHNPHEANARLLELVAKEKFDLFISHFSEKEIFKETLSCIKEKGIPTLLLLFDNLVIPYVHLNIAKEYDLVWLTSKETEHMFKRRGAKTIFLPYAANPNLERYSGKEVTGIGFAGSPYGSRANMINKIASNNIDMYCHCLPIENAQSNSDPLLIDKEKVLYEDPCAESKAYTFAKCLTFREGRKILEGYCVNKIKKQHAIDESSVYFHKEHMVSPKDVYKIYGRYALALSSTTARNTGVLKKPLYICNLRSFEIPMAGGIQLCRYNPELAEYFEPEKEIVFFKDDEEMVEKARFYLRDNNYELRQKIRERARKRAEGEHTWYHRFRRVFDEIGIK